MVCVPVIDARRGEGVRGFRSFRAIRGDVVPEERFERTHARAHYLADRRTDDYY